MKTLNNYQKVMIHCMTGKKGTPARKLTAGVQDAIHAHDMSDDDIIAAALDIVSRRMRAGTALVNPTATRDFLRLHYAGMEHEVFTVIFLDNRHRIIGVEDLFRGTIDGASVHPREVVKRCLQLNAAACVFAHNHPSGVAEPSQADEMITRRLKSALELVDIRVLDHLVVAGAHCESFAERGLL